MDAILETENGGFVHRGTVIPFLTHPRVVLWGTRVFMFHNLNMQTGVLTYRECFTYAIID